MLVRSLVPRIDQAIGGGPIHVPAQFEAEVFVAIRRQLARGLIDRASATTALFDLRQLRAEHHRVGDLMPEALVLRDRFGGHDVFYAILARRLGAALVTSDVALARAATGYVAVAYVGRDALATSS